MRVLWAVVIDLWNFLRHAITAEPSSIERLRLGTRTQLPRIEPPPAVALLAHTSASTVDLQPGTPSGTVAIYATTKSQTLLYANPTQGFDGVVARVAYATTLALVRRSGRWCEVRWHTATAWVLTEDIDLLDQVLPKLQTGRIYDDPEEQMVLRLRSCIEDSFQGGATSAPLLGVEYVTYELWLHGIVVPWPITHARVPGSWQRKLRGQPEVYIDVKPRTGAVMEYIIEDVGFVAYVAAVAPDNAVTIRAVGLTHEGQYTEERLPHEVWRELRPVFIIVT